MAKALLTITLTICCILCVNGQSISNEELIINDSGLILTDGIRTDTLSEERPEESYEIIEYKPRTSTLHIPIDINIAFLEKKLNEEFSGLLFEDNNIEDDSMMVKAWKESEFKIGYEDNTLIYSIPIKFWIKKRFDLGLTHTDRTIEGAIKLNFKTVIQISKDWQLIPRTSIENYTWLAKPTMKVAFMNVPITYFVDKIIEENKLLINSTIDTTFKENIPISTYIQNIWNAIQDPIDVSTGGYKAWIKNTPQKLYCTPIKGYQGKISTTIGIKCLMELYLGKMPRIIRKDMQIPQLKMYAKTDENYSLNIMADVPYFVLDSIARDAMVGQTFGEGKRSIMVDSVEIYGHDEKLIIGLDVSGFINGEIYLECIPFYNSNDYTIRVKDVDYKIKTKNILAKMVNLFYKKGLKKKLEEELVFSIKDEYYLIKDISRSELFNMEVVNNVKLNGMINEIDVDKLFISQEGLRISLNMNGKLRIIVE